MPVIYPDDPQQAARQAQRVLDATEALVEEAVEKATRYMLARMSESLEESLTAAADPDDPRRPRRRREDRDKVGLLFFGLGDVRRFWEEGVDEYVINAVRETFDRGRRSVLDDPATVTSIDATGDYLAHVRDRLSRTAEPPIPDQAFDTVRKVVASEVAQGTTTDRMAQRLAEELKWEGPSARHLRGRRVDLERRIEERLESAELEGISRTVARKTDPTIRLLQDERTEVVKQQDADKSLWQTRAERIARTETTGAYNAGAYQAQIEAEVGARMWVATPDGATRETHLDMSGTCVGLDEAFRFPDGELLFPGDPSGPAAETINCRCTVVAGRSCEALGALSRELGVDAEFERERQRQAAEERKKQLNADLRAMRRDYPEDLELEACERQWREAGLDDDQVELLKWRLFKQHEVRSGLRDEVGEDQIDMATDYGRLTPEELATLPQGVPLQAPRHKAGDIGDMHSEWVEPGTFVIEDGTMWYVENRAVREHLERAVEAAGPLLDPSTVDPYRDPVEAIQAIQESFDRVSPSNFSEQMGGMSITPKVIYKAGSSTRDRMAVQGESVNILGSVYNRDQTLFMYGAGLSPDRDEFVNDYILAHEIGHAFHGSVNAAAQRIRVEASAGVFEAAKAEVPKDVWDEVIATIEDLDPDEFKALGRRSPSDILASRRGPLDFRPDETRPVRDAYIARNRDRVMDELRKDVSLAEKYGVAVPSEAGRFADGEDELFTAAGRVLEAQFDQEITFRGDDIVRDEMRARDAAAPPRFFGPAQKAIPGDAFQYHGQADTDRRWAIESAIGTTVSRHRRLEGGTATGEFAEAKFPSDMSVISLESDARDRRTMQEWFDTIDAYDPEDGRPPWHLPYMTPEEEEALAHHAFVSTSPWSSRLITSSTGYWGERSMGAVTNYGASFGDYTEDFAEAYALWYGDKVDPAYGYSAITGEPLGFADVFPERDRYFRELYEFLGLELPPEPERVAPEQPRLLPKSILGPDVIDPDSVYDHEEESLFRGIRVSDDPRDPDYFGTISIPGGSKRVEYEILDWPEED